MGLHELGPLAMKATKSIRINSTCTVFAGAELRDRLALGDKREDILPACTAPSCCARCRSSRARAASPTSSPSPAAWPGERGRGQELRQAGQGKLRGGEDQHRPDSIYTGALGASEFARRAVVEAGEMTITAGIDIGTGAVKTVLFRVEGDKTEWLGKRNDRIRQPIPSSSPRRPTTRVLRRPALQRPTWITSPPPARARTSLLHRPLLPMTTHAWRGSLDPRRRAVLDIGALQRAGDPQRRARQRCETYKMTSQCASGSGQFLENIARYLGIAQDEIGSAVEPGRQPRGGVEHLRGAGRDRRHQHGVARHHGAQHPQGHPHLDGRSPRQTARLPIGARAWCSAPAAWRSTRACSTPSTSRSRSEDECDRVQPPGLALRRRDRGPVGAFRHEKLARLGGQQPPRPETSLQEEAIAGLLINDDCTACDACVEECPNEAITAGNPIYVIDPGKLTECVGAFDEAVQLVCPADCTGDHLDYRES